MAELYNKTITPVYRLIALAEIIKNQKGAIIECEIKATTFQRQINKVQLSGGKGDLVHLQNQVTQLEMLHLGTSAALEVTREVLFDLYDKNHNESAFIAEWEKIYGTPKKDVLA